MKQDPTYHPNSSSGTFEQHRQRTRPRAWKVRPVRNRRRGTNARRMRAFWSVCGRLLKLTSPFLFAAGLFLVSQHTWQLLRTSTYFGLKSLHYEGSAALPKAALMRYLGIHLGDNLLNMNLAQMVRKLKAHPRVRTVHVKRKFPCTLSIQLSTHIPVAVLHLKNPYLLNQDGIPYARVHDLNEVKGLLQIKGFEQFTREAHESQMRKVFLQVLAVRKKYKQLNLSKYKSIEEIEYNATLGYILHLGDARIRIGEDQFEERLQYLKQVYSAFARDGVRDFRYIYLNSKRNPNHATIRFLE